MTVHRLLSGVGQSAMDEEHTCYALEGVSLFVVGGDGANWIRRGVDELGSVRRSVFQLDGFHLSRACG